MFGSNCQYQTSVFQDNRVSPDVIPDSFSHINKCQEFPSNIRTEQNIRTGEQKQVRSLWKPSIEYLVTSIIFN